jgi:hypothetical protein
MHSYCLLSLIPNLQGAVLPFEDISSSLYFFESLSPFQSWDETPSIEEL